jgi:hypothetical protein
MFCISKLLALYKTIFDRSSKVPETECYSNEQHHANLVADSQALEKARSLECASEIRALWLSECENFELDKPIDSITPKEHGDRLLQLTKSKALRRTWKSDAA